MSVTGLAHACIASTDLAVTERFYVEGLGLRKAFDFVRKGALCGYYLEMGKGTYLEVFLQAEPPQEGNSPMKHIALAVKDLDAVRARLIQNGYEISEKVMGADHTWQCWTCDPGGKVPIEIQEYTRKSCQKTGEPCVLD
jgi:catechol 2,3-dioxygenase-like lactoylglutathione lyase family enzyme